MSDADKKMNPLHFGSDPANTHPESGYCGNPDSNPSSGLLEILALAEVCTL